MPRFIRGQADLDFIYCAQTRKQNIVQPYKFSKTLEKIRKYEEKFRICLEMIGRKLYNFFIQVAFWIELEIDYFIELFVLKK